MDFSVVNDLSYYNGITFQGFVEGVPESVLSGGRYDNLLHRMGRSGEALGFALYMDALERTLEAEALPEADILFLYPEDAPAADVARAVRQLSREGRVYAALTEPENMSFCRRVVYAAGEVQE